MINCAIITGRLTRDPELRYIPSTGKAVATFNIAVDRPYTGKDGQKQTDFFNIVVWGKMAENCANYLAKGRLAAIKGSIQNRSYDAQDGTKRYITEIVADQVQFLEKATGAKQEGYQEDKFNSGADVFTPPEGFSPKGLSDADYAELDKDDVPL